MQPICILPSKYEHIKKLYRKLELNAEVFKVYWLKSIKKSSVLVQITYKMYPLCCFCGELTTIYIWWIEMFFFLFSNKQKIIAYTNEKLIFQAFHYHSQGNGKKVSNSVRECWYYCYFLNNSVRFTFNVGLNIENVQKQMFLFWLARYTFTTTRKIFPQTKT